MSAAVAALRYPSATLRHKVTNIFLKNNLNLITNKLLSLQKENKIMIPDKITEVEQIKDLFVYLKANTKRPIKYLLELTGFINAGGKDRLLEIIKLSNIPDNKKIGLKKKTLQLANLYDNYLKQIQ